MDDEGLALFAAALGIEPHELEDLDYRLDTNESEDGVQYGYIVTLADGNPPEILSRIEGLQGNTVRLDAWVFDTPDGPDEN